MGEGFGEFVVGVVVLLGRRGTDRVLDSRRKVGAAEGATDLDLLLAFLDVFVMLLLISVAVTGLLLDDEGPTPAGAVGFVFDVILALDAAVVLSATLVREKVGD